MNIMVTVAPVGEEWRNAGVNEGARFKATCGRVPRTHADGSRRRSLHIGSVLLCNEDGTPLLDSLGVQFRLLHKEWCEV